MKAVILIHSLYFTLIKTVVVEAVLKCESKVELRAVLLSCSNKDSSCDDDDPLSQVMAAEEAQLLRESNNYQSFEGQEEAGLPNTVKDCKRKLIITLKVKNAGKIPCDDEYIVVDHVFDPISGGRGRLLTPVVLKLRQEQMVQLYGLQFQRVVNSNPFEEQKVTNEVCSVSLNNATCGISMYNGQPIPYSEGFCCSYNPEESSKHQLSDLSQSDSFLYRDSKLISLRNNGYFQDNTPSIEILDPDLLTLKTKRSNSSKDSGDKSTEDETDDCCPIRALSPDRLPNFLFELDRRIVCGKGNFLGDLCRLRDEKTKIETGSLMREFNPNAFDTKLKNEDGNSVAYPKMNNIDESVNLKDISTFASKRPEMISPVTHLDSNNKKGHKKINLNTKNLNQGIIFKNLIGAFAADQATKENHNSNNINRVSRGKRENFQEPDKKYRNSVHSHDILTKQRNRPLELFHKRPKKANTRFKEVEDHKIIFPGHDYYKVKPPKYFFYHDSFIVHPSDPLAIFNSSSKSSDEIDYNGEEQVNDEKKVHGNDEIKNSLKINSQNPKNNNFEALNIRQNINRIRNNEKEKLPKEGFFGKLYGKKSKIREKFESNLLKGNIRYANSKSSQNKAISNEGERYKDNYFEKNKKYYKIAEKENNPEQGKFNEKLRDKSISYHKNFKDAPLKENTNNYLAKQTIRIFLTSKNAEKQKMLERAKASENELNSGNLQGIYNERSEKLMENEEENRKNKVDQEKPNTFEETAFNNDIEYKTTKSNLKPFKNEKETNEEEGPIDSIKKETSDNVNGAFENKQSIVKTKFSDSKLMNKARNSPFLNNYKISDQEDGNVDFDFEIIHKSIPEVANSHLSSAKLNEQLKMKVYPPQKFSSKYSVNNLGLNRKVLFKKNFQNYLPFHQSLPKYYMMEDEVDRRSSSIKDYYLHPKNMNSLEEDDPNRCNRFKKKSMNQCRNSGKAKHKVDLRKNFNGHYFTSPVDYDTKGNFINPKLSGNNYLISNHLENVFRKNENPETCDSIETQKNLNLENEREKLLSKIRLRRSVKASFEPAKGFIKSKLDSTVDNLPETTLKHKLVRQPESCSFFKGDKDSSEVYTKANENSSRTNCDVNVSFETISSKDKFNYLKSQSNSLANKSQDQAAYNRERLLRSYTNAPDYVLEKIKKELKEKRQVNDKNKKVIPAYSSPDRKKDQNEAHCLRFGDLWYSMYMIKKPVVAQTVGLQIFEKHSPTEGITEWRDLTKGKMVRVGTFLPKAEDDVPTLSMTYVGVETNQVPSAIDSDNYLLLIPSHVSNPNKYEDYPQIDGGPEEYLVVESKAISSGADCNMIGTSFEAFARQPERCFRPPGSCLKRQPIDLWREDMEARIRGKRGKYFVENFGTVPNSPVKTYTNVTGEYLALEYYGDYMSTIEIEVKADFNALVRKGSNAQIPTVYIDGTYPKKTRIILSVFNIGLTSSYFRPRLGDCPPDLDPAWCPLEGPLVIIPPQQRHDFRLDLSGPLPPNKIYVTVQVLDQQNKKVAHRKIIIKKGDRCICAFHCKCNCFGNTDGRTCRKLDLENYRAAGYVGSYPYRVGTGGLASDTIKSNLRIILFTAAHILLFMGAIKGILGIFYRKIGIAGIRVIIGPRKIEKYYECDLESASPQFDDCGFPVHPDNYTPVQLVPLWVEIFINFFFFFLYPLRGLWLLLLSLSSCSLAVEVCDNASEQAGCGNDTDQPLLSKCRSPTCANYALTAHNTKQGKAEDYLPYLPYKGDEDPLEEDDTDFVLQEMKRYRKTGAFL